MTAKATTATKAKAAKPDKVGRKIKPMTPGVPQAARARAYAAGAIVMLGLVGVGYKAWALQVDQGDKYRELAERQHAMRIDIPGPRGEVVDVHGRPLAVSADAESIWANPHAVRDVAATAEKLAALVGPSADPRVLESRLAGDRHFVWLLRHVSPELAKKVRDAKLAGIEVASEPRRWYPGKTLAGPVIGRADIDGNGVDGIELSMNDVLEGKRGAVTALRDAHGRKMLAAGTAPIEAGAVVKLSLDRSIQAIADEALAKSITENKAKNGVAVVLDVKTSRVLAMSSYPTYDPNSGADHGARNRPVTDSYEAGSVMKVFTVSGALEEGVVTPTTTFSGASYKVGPKTMRDTHAHPYLTTTQVIQVSSNVGASKIALRLGRERMHRYFKLFGFGAKSGIELPGETTGKVRPAETWRDVQMATMSYGYGLTVTPLQLAAGFAAIGNDGMYTEPRIVDEVRDPDGNVTYRGEGKQHRILSAEHAAQMRAMLATVFEKGSGEHPINGTAATVVVPGFKCGGKTGTAYKYDHAIRTYSTNRYLGSFAGLAPIDDPRLAIVVMIDEPGGTDHYGGLVAGPVFAQIASESLRYLGVAGDPLPPPKPVPGAAAKKPAKQDAPDPVVDTLDDATDIAPDDADDSGVEIPDFAGMGVGRALDEARKLHLDLDIEGSGQVIAQDPPPGRGAAVTRVKLTFSDDTRKISAP
jgi:cell division protein FtsI (penicillin-binding protein 3)